MSYAYPVSLPLPVGLEFTPATRLRRSEVQGGQLQQVRIERDFRGTESLRLLFTEDEAEQFDAWFTVALRDGGMLWHAPWPLPSGWNAPAVRKFTATPAWSLQAPGIWSVSVATEVLGAFAGELVGAYDVPNVLDGSWLLDGGRYLYQYVRPVS